MINMALTNSQIDELKQGAKANMIIGIVSIILLTIIALMSVFG